MADFVANQANGRHVPRDSIRQPPRPLPQLGICWAARSDPSESGLLVAVVVMADLEGGPEACVCKRVKVGSWLAPAMFVVVVGGGGSGGGGDQSVGIGTMSPIPRARAEEHPSEVRADFAKGLAKSARMDLGRVAILGR